MKKVIIRFKEPTKKGYEVYYKDNDGKMVQTGFVTGGDGYTYYYDNLVRTKGFTKIGND